MEIKRVQPAEFQPRTVSITFTTEEELCNFERVIANIPMLPTQASPEHIKEFVLNMNELIYQAKD